VFNKTSFLLTKEVERRLQQPILKRGLKKFEGARRGIGFSVQLSLTDFP
jgi:hypothetical protein